MKDFFDKVREYFGPLSKSQVDGLDFLFHCTAELPIRHRAYILATAWHETARTMRPIEEFGKGKGKKYGVPDPVTGQTYYGRGYVQLTWKTNYERAQQRLKILKVITDDVDFVKNPNLVMQQNLAACILITGMKEGWFTGKKLSDYQSYVDMRRIVNGTDKANAIAVYANVFEAAIKAENAKAEIPTPDFSPPVSNKPPEGTGKSVAAIVLAFIFALFAAFGAWVMRGGN